MCQCAIPHFAKFCSVLTRPLTAFGTHTDTLPNSSTSPPHRGHRTDRRCPTSAEILKGTKEYFLRRRLTSLTCHTPLTEVERRKMQEYYEECARVIGPDYWSPRFIDSVQGAAEKDKNTTLKSLL